MEYKIALYKAEGKTLKEISYLEKKISFGTISTHKTRLMLKTGCKNARDLYNLVSVALQLNNNF